MKPPNPRQLKFIELYLATGNAAKSYAAVYDQPNGDAAKVSAAKLLTKANVKEIVDRATDAAVERAQITADWYAGRVKLEAEREGDGSSHGARVAALRLAAEMLNIGHPAPPAQEGMTFEQAVRVLAALAEPGGETGAAGGGADPLI